MVEVVLNVAVQVEVSDEFQAVVEDVIEADVVVNVLFEFTRLDSGGDLGCD